MGDKWLDWAVELQGIAQCALAYCKDPFDKERFERVREISAEMVSLQSEIPVEKVRDLFCNETGYQTPKLDCRAAIFQEGKILLVQEKDETWALPGGWVDAGLSVKENIIKEVKEEAGLTVTVERVIAVQDREKHNLPRYPYKVCKVFALCALVGGSFEKNMETIDTAYFSIDQLPKLSGEKINEEQIRMCFDAYGDENWKTLID